MERSLAKVLFPDACAPIKVTISLTSISISFRGPKFLTISFALSIFKYKKLFSILIISLNIQQFYYHHLL